MTQHDGGIPIFRTRSAEETEAAHDLLSLSQSLPPLPAPGAVTIHHHIPNGDLPPSAIYTYRPLSPEPSYRTTSPLPVSIPCYQPPIVYVVQVPAAPTPPTSECSSDAENQQICLTDNVNDTTATTTIPVQTISGSNEDIIILPLSPEPEQRTKDNETSSVIVSSITTQYDHEHEPHQEHHHHQQQHHHHHEQSQPPPIREHSVITTTTTAATTNNLNIPDRRRNRTNRTNNINNNNNNNKNNDISNINNNNNNKTLNNNVKNKRHYAKRGKTVSVFSTILQIK